MANLRKNQREYLAGMDDDLAETHPLVTHVVEENGVQGTSSIDWDEAEGVAYKMDGSDWGGLHNIMRALGEGIEGSEAPHSSVIQVVEKKTGDVLHVIHVNMLPFGTPELEALKKLTHHYFRQIDYDYSGLTSEEQECITEDEFGVVTDWARSGFPDEPSFPRTAEGMLEYWNVYAKTGGPKDKYDSRINLAVGTMVRARKALDTKGTGTPDVDEGMLGYVFQEAEGEFGPLVKWTRGGVCNVYPRTCEAVWAPPE